MILFMSTIPPKTFKYSVELVGLLEVATGPKVDEFELEGVRVHQDVLILDVSESGRYESCLNGMKL